MIATDIFLALWKRKNMIAVVTAAALLACHLYLFVSQTHTAAVYIKFMEESAVDGVASNGTNLDPYEIAEPYIVGKALEQMGMEQKNISSIAQRIKVTPVFSSAEQEKYASWINQFSNYENTEENKDTPVYYRIEFKSKEGVQFAQAFLSALIHQYRSYYTKRYSGFYEVALVSETVVQNADYFYSLELIQTQIEDMISYLEDIVNEDSDYRSPKTGYSLMDLVDAYDLLIETSIAPVTQYILDTGVSKDVSTLMAGLQQSSDMAQKESDENAEKAITQEEMMLLYAEKNKEYVSTVISPDDYDAQVRGDVERDKAYIRDLTTYDQMMFDYVEYAVKSGDLLIDKAYINENLSKFGNTAFSGSAPIEEISDIYNQYAHLTTITEETLEGYNAQKSGKVLLQVSGVRITETLPELLYYAVSGILALCLGFVGIVAFEFKKKRVKNEQSKKLHLTGYFDMNFGDDMMMKLVVRSLPEITFVIEEHVQTPILNEGNVISQSCEECALLPKLVVTGCGFMINNKDALRTEAVQFLKGNNPGDYCLGCNIEPLDRPVKRFLISKKMDKFQLITCRDQVSYHWLRQNTSHPEIHYLPDLLFSLPDEWIPESKSSDKLGISMMHRAGDREDCAYYRAMAELADEWVRITGKDVILMAFDTGKENDVFACQAVKSLMKFSNHAEIAAHRDGTEILAAFAQCEKIIAARFHATVLALRMGKQLYPLIFRDKVRNLLKDVKYPFSVSDLDALDKASLHAFLAEEQKPYPLTQDIYMRAKEHAQLLKQQYEKK